MQVQVEKAGPCVCKVFVSVPKDRVNAAFDAAFRVVARGVQIPGFRAGKVPRHLVEAQCASKIADEAKQKLLGDTLLQAMDEGKISAVAMPSVVIKVFKRDHDFSYEATVDVQPEVKLEKYKGLKVKRAEAMVDDADIERELNGLHNRAAQYIPILDRDLVQENDVLVLDWSAKSATKDLSRAHAQDITLPVGTGTFAALSTRLIGKKVPGDYAVSVNFPADHAAKQFAGHEVDFSVKLKALQRKELPAMDDAFAEDMGEPNLAALRSKIREQLGQSRQQEAESKTRESLLHALVDANPFEVPHSMVVAQAERIVQSVANRVGQMLGQKITVSSQEFMDLRTNSEKEAEFRVRNALLLIEVAKAANLKADESEVAAEIDKIVEKAGPQGQAVRAYLEESKAQEELRFKILENKTIKYLLDNAEYVASDP